MLVTWKDYIVTSFSLELSSSFTAMLEDLNYQYSNDSFRRELDVDQTVYKAKDNTQMSLALRQEWYPCSQGYSLRSYISQPTNGPFFRPLLIRWQKLGCPSLSCLQGENEMENIQQQSLENVTDEPWLNVGNKNDLLTLCVSQEKSIIQAIKALDENLASFEKMTKKPFDSFAAQIGLYSSIEAELNRIEWNSNLDLTQLYQNAWQNVLNQFDNKRKGSCASRQDHKCLLDAIWGEACQWPLKALQYAFLGYTLALPKLDEKLSVEQLQSSDETLNCSSDPATISTSSSAMDYDYHPNFDAGNPNETSLSMKGDIYSSSRPTGQVENADTQNLNIPSNNHLSPNKPWTRKSFQDLLFSSDPLEFSHTEQVNESEVNIPRKMIFEQRRPTLSDFWRFGGITGMFHLPDLTPQTEVGDDQDYFAFSTGEMRGNEAVRRSKSPVSVQNTQPILLSPSNSSPTRIRLQQSLSESQIAKVGLKNNFSSTSSSRQSPVRFDHDPQKTSIRARASTLRGDRPLIDSTTAQTKKSTSQTRENDQKRRQKRMLGRQRYQRYYKRTMLQRQAMQTTIDQLRIEVENSSTDEIRENIKNILNTPGKTHEELLEEYYSGLKTDPSTTTFDHKRMSKIRLRNNDVENISIISRLAKLVEEVPLNQLINILNDENGEEDSLTGLNSLLEAFMSQRDQWSALIAAEWRLLNGKASSVRLMVKLLSLATDQEAPPDLNNDSDSENDEEDIY